MPKSRRGREQTAGPSTPRAHVPTNFALLAEIINFLERRRLPVPEALSAACPISQPTATPVTTTESDPTTSPDFTWAMTLLSGVKERDKRALERFVKKDKKASSSALDTDEVPPPVASDDENDGPEGPPAVRGGEWPCDVSYTNDYTWGDDVPPELRRMYQPRPPRKRPRRPCKRTFAAAISDVDHPACGENGLFAAVALAHGAWVIDYVGAICLGANEDKSSDYVCDFGEHSELALDANRRGNEGRFVNDYRNTGRRANVEFRTRRDALGELRQGIFVCAKHGVVEGEELCAEKDAPSPPPMLIDDALCKACPRASRPA